MRRTIFVRLAQLTSTALMLLILLTACGGKTQEGVDLQPVRQQSTVHSYGTPTPTPDPSAALGLSGRLLYVKGGHIEIRDLVTGETQVIKDMRTFSPVVINTEATRGVFIAFPDLGVVDLNTGTIRTATSVASNPISFGLSPDSQWVALVNGSFTRRLLVINTGDLSLHTVASKSEAFFNWAWTTDSRLVWGEQSDTPQWMILDTTTYKSSPVKLADLRLEVPAPAQLSPDGTHVANVPIAFGPPPGQQNQDNPDACFDSFVELYDASAIQNSFNQRGQTLWTEAGLVASSPQWLTKDMLMFVKLGSGKCGEVEGDPVRQVMVIDITATNPQPRSLAGPLGNADDPNDRTQHFSKQVGHLYSPSPDARYVAWVSGGLDGGESRINVTDVETGSTQTILRFAIADARDAADYIENYLVRQVIWLK